MPSGKQWTDLDWTINICVMYSGASPKSDLKNEQYLKLYYKNNSK